MISVAEDRLSIEFSRFDLASYEVFLKSKQLPESEIVFDDRAEIYRLTAPSRFASLFGVAAPVSRKDWLPFPAWMHDYQRDIGMKSLIAKRWADWWDCGLGKGPSGLEWCRQVAHVTGGRVLILTLKNLIGEMLSECAKFYPTRAPKHLRHECLNLVVLKTRADLISFCNGPRDGSIGITNYEKFVDQTDEKNSGMIRDLRKLSGLWADESSILKSGGGVIKWNLIKSARGIEYKRSSTATPAPNDIMEYASQAAFLEKIRTENDVLWTYFQRDGKSGLWKVRPHALQAFYRFMSSWSIYLRNPARYGWKDNLKSIPAPQFIEHKLPVTMDQARRAAAIRAGAGQGQKQGRKGRTDELAGACEDSLGMVGRTKLSQLEKGFIYSEGRTVITRVMSKKPLFVANLALEEMDAGRQVLVWTQFDEETAILAEMIGGSAVLTGKTSEKDRAEIIRRFKRGEIRILITRPDLLGFGQNFQHCESMIFSALTDSYEDFYQAVRRSYRYGQTKSVRIHLPYIPELTGAIRENVWRKAGNFERDTETQELHYIEAMRAAA